MQGKRYLRAKGTSSKVDENSITFQLWKGNSIGLLA